jgi:prepilin-type N-terminal cleavage/methylation domain-containing protein
MMRQADRQRSSLFGQPWAGRGHGFTLIELLVVIAIIAILAAILFPVFATARRKARLTQCTSNLKNMALSVLMYMQDYDEVYPTGLIWGAPGPRCLQTPDPWGCMYANVPPTSRFGSGNCIGASPPYNCSFFFFRDYSGNFRPSVAQQTWAYLRNAQIAYDPEDPRGDRFAAGRWSGDIMAVSYMWVAGPSFGNRMCQERPFPPHSLAQIERPAFMQFVQDNWVAMHTEANPPFRWNIAFADGHVKLTLWLDPGLRCQFDTAPPLFGGPWAWNHCNPHDPQEVNTPLPRQRPYCLN